MFIKIPFTVDHTYPNALRILTYTLQSTSITSKETFTSVAGGWHPDLTTGIDWANVELYRDVDPTNVKMRYSKDNTSWIHNHYWLTEFEVHDDPGQKWYVQSSNTTTNSIVNNFAVGSTLQNGNMTSTALLSSAADAGTGSFITTRLNTADTTNNMFSTSSNPPQGVPVRCIWAYITNDVLFLYFTLTATTNTGFHESFTTGAAAPYMAGPYMFGNYERYDYWNKSSNGILPIMSHNIYRPSHNGFGWDAQLGQHDHVALPNMNYNTLTTNHSPFRIHSIIDATPRITSSWPLIRWTFTNWGTGFRNNSINGLNYNQTQATSTTTSGSWGPLVSINANYRFVSSDLKSKTFAMLPITWSDDLRQCLGGNFTSRSGIYLFNGEFQSGDTFTFNNKTYVIFPVYGAGYSQRVGIAVPKE